MLRFILYRIIQAIPLIIALLFLLFILLELTPGDPVQAIVGQYPVPEAFRAAIEEKFRLNDPFIVRFFSFLTTILKGDLGYSFVLNQPVSDVVFSRLVNTVILAVSGFGLGIIFGGLLGIISGITKSWFLDSALSTLILILYSVPVFWLGQILVLYFSLRLGWFPTQGMSPAFTSAQGWDLFVQRLQYFVLPITTYAIYEAAKTARMARASVVDTIHNGYIVTAKMKGLTSAQIVHRHVLRNSSLPVVAAMGYSFAVALGGTVLIETVFSWPGIGLLLVDAIRQRDNQVILGTVVVIGCSVIVVNLIIDLFHAWLDPRIRV